MAHGFGKCFLSSVEGNSVYLFEESTATQVHSSATKKKKPVQGEDLGCAQLTPYRGLYCVGFGFDLGSKKCSFYLKAVINILGNAQHKLKR